MHSEPARRYVMALLRRRLRETAMVCARERYVSVVFGGGESACVEGQHCHANGVVACVVVSKWAGMGMQYLFCDDESLFLFKRIRGVGASAFLLEIAVIRGDGLPGRHYRMRQVRKRGRKIRCCEGLCTVCMAVL